MPTIEQAKIIEPNEDLARIIQERIIEENKICIDIFIDRAINIIDEYFKTHIISYQQKKHVFPIDAPNIHNYIIDKQSCECTLRTEFFPPQALLIGLINGIRDEL